MVLGFLFLGQFAENDGFQIHPSPYKGHELIVFYGCVVFHGLYVPHFLCPSIIDGHLVGSRTLLLYTGLK